jgi:hypothetical protein
VSEKCTAMGNACSLEYWLIWNTLKWLNVVQLWPHIVLWTL